MRWTDPSGHCPACAAAAALFAGAGITISAPVIAAIVGVVAIGALAVFLSDANNRAWLSEQISNGITDVSAFTNSLRSTIDEARSHRDGGGGWENRKTTDGETVRVRRLSDREVHERGLHSDKQGQGYSGKTAVYEDDDGNIYVGGRGGGPIEAEF